MQKGETDGSAVARSHLETGVDPLVELGRFPPQIGGPELAPGTKKPSSNVNLERVFFCERLGVTW